MFEGFNYDLGAHVTDQVSGFEGIINGRILWDNGCIQYSIKAKVKENGDIGECRFIDGDHLQQDNERSITSYYGDPTFEFSNGEKVTSIKTPFKGHISGCMQSLNGCIQYSVTSLNLEKGKVITEWLDETEIKSLKSAIKQKTRNTGGPDSRSPL